MERQFSPPRAGSYLPEHTVSSHKRNSAKYRMTLSTYVIAYFYVRIFQSIWTGIAQSVWRIATAWTVRGSNSDGSEIFWTRPDRPCIPPIPLWNGYRVSLLGLKRSGAWGWQSALIYRRGKKKSRSISPLSPWTIRGLFQHELRLLSHISQTALI